MASGCLAALGMATLCWAQPARAQDTIFVDDSVNDGLVAHWKFDEPGTTTARAYVGPVSGTLENTATMAFGPLPPVSFLSAGVLRLDGVIDATPQRVVIADDAALNLVTNFTVAAWVQRDAADIGTSSTLFDSGANLGTWYVGFLDNNKLTFTTDGVSDFATNLVIGDSNYHHVAFTKSGGALFAYLDGVPSAGVSVPLTIPVPSGAKLVGGKTSNNNAPFGGLIDDLRLYNRSLSVVEVQRLAAGNSCTTDGTTWGTAFRDLHCALAVANPGNDIWIGQGTYKPGSSPFVPYQLKNGVDLFGGFTGIAGTQETLLGQRPAFDANAPLTILNGDILGNDAATPFGDASLYTDNSNTVVLAGASVSATVDALRVQGGNARTGTGDGTFGGGLRALTGANIALTNVSFFGNQATGRGGAVFSRAPLQIVGASFAHNRSVNNDGGALFITTTVSISTSQFLTNTAVSGGAVRTSGPITVHQSTFQGNRAINFHGGAIEANAPLTVTNSTFILNRAGFSGGAIESTQVALIESSNFLANRVDVFVGGAIEAQGPLQVRFGSFTGNSAPQKGGAIATSVDPATVEGATFANNRVLGGNCGPAACSAGNGGAIASGGPLTITAATLTTNTARLIGGAVFALGPLVIRESSLSGNQAGLPVNSGNTGLGRGGAAFANDTLVLTSVDVWNNQAAVDGGGLMVSAPLDSSLAVAVTIADSLFASNSAVAGSGGGVHTESTAAVAATRFLTNTAATDGGALHTVAPLTLSSSQFISNTAFRDGGGVSSVLPILVDGQTQLTDNLFQRNRATRFGGAARLSGASTGDDFLDNRSGSEGGALMATGPMTITRALFLRNQSFLSGAIVAQGPRANPPTQRLAVLNSLFAANGVSNSAGATDMRLFDLDLLLLHNTFADPVQLGSFTTFSTVLLRSNGQVNNNIWANYPLGITADISSTIIEDFDFFANVPVPVSGNIQAGANSLTGDPLFMNPAADDYHISPLSPARDSGTNVGVTVDFEGQPRPIGPGFDMGYDETTAVAPTAVAGGPYQGGEGSPLALNGSASSDNGPISSFAWDCTNDGSFEVTLPDATGATCLYPDNGAFTLRLRVTDGDGETATTTTTVVIANVNPVVTAPAPQSVQDGAPGNFALGSFVDPGADAPWQVTVNWGDGSADTTATVGSPGAIPPQSHTYTGVATRTVTVSVRDKDIGADSQQFSVTVNPVLSPAQYLPLVEK